MVFDAHKPRLRLLQGDLHARHLRQHEDGGRGGVSSAKTASTTAVSLRMCGHYLVEPTACTPASGWEKGQVENQVGLVRERFFFTPRLRVASYDELNAWLLEPMRCLRQGAQTPRADRPQRSGRHSRRSARSWC